MTGIKKVLYTFWSQFGIPAYLKDCVPDDAQPDYITYSVTQPGLGGFAVLTAFNWHRKSESGNKARTEMMDKIATAIPVGGLLLSLPEGGYLMIYRNDADFQSDWQDDVDTDIIAGRTSYIVYYYNT